VKAEFIAEKWTTVSGIDVETHKSWSHELWATVQYDGKTTGQPVAFGPQDKMQAYAKELNDTLVTR